MPPAVRRRKRRRKGSDADPHQSCSGVTSGRREAHAAGNVARLAVVRGELSKAGRDCQVALEATPEGLEAALHLGDGWISCGDLAQASTVFDAAIQQARAASDQGLEGWAPNGLGDGLVAQGDGPGAWAACQAGLAIAEGLAKRVRRTPRGRWTWRCLAQKWEALNRC